MRKTLVFHILLMLHGNTATNKHIAYHAKRVDRTWFSGFLFNFFSKILFKLWLHELRMNYAISSMRAKRYNFRTICAPSELYRRRRVYVFGRLSKDRINFLAKMFSHAYIGIFFFQNTIIYLTMYFKRVNQIGHYSFDVPLRSHYKRTPGRLKKKFFHFFSIPSTMLILPSNTLVTLDTSV